mmetsp:Transcript_26627/g.42626  ORF Transcript_26627/g.42626 Transcript_26627/m.42626 type:complete len:312 (-) Transcript_26627:2567-3502(-)
MKSTVLFRRFSGAGIILFWRCATIPRNLGGSQSSDCSGVSRNTVKLILGKVSKVLVFEESASRYSLVSHLAPPSRYRPVIATVSISSPFLSSDFVFTAVDTVLLDCANFGACVFVAGAGASATCMEMEKDSCSSVHPFFTLRRNASCFIAVNSAAGLNSPVNHTLLGRAPIHFESWSWRCMRIAIHSPNDATFHEITSHDSGTTASNSACRTRRILSLIGVAPEIESSNVCKVLRTVRRTSCILSTSCSISACSAVFACLDLPALSFSGFHGDGTFATMFVAISVTTCSMSTSPTRVECCGLRSVRNVIIC